MSRQVATEPSLATTPRPAKSRRSSRATLAVVCVATAMLILDIAVVNTALSAVRADLHASLNGLKWVVDSYTLALIAASLHDREGDTGDALDLTHKALYSTVTGVVADRWIRPVARSTPGRTSH